MINPLYFTLAFFVVCSKGTGELVVKAGSSLYSATEKAFYFYE
jgi:hypothetical protein